MPADRYRRAHEAREAREHPRMVAARQAARVAGRRRHRQEPVSIFGVSIPGSENRHTKSLPARTLADLAATARDAPRGAATFADALYQDAREPRDWAAAARKAKREGRRPPPPPKPWGRTRALLGASAGQLVEDVRHPLRNPGNTLLSVGGLVTGGVLTGARAGGALSAAARASRVKPGRVPRVVTSKRKAKAMDPGKLGVGRMVRELEKAERQATQGPLRAGLRQYRRRPTRGERATGAALTANVAARRQRAAEELRARANIAAARQARARGARRLRAQERRDSPQG